MSTEFKTTLGTQPRQPSTAPMLFGIRFTPMVQGIACGVLGLLGLYYIMTSMVNPVNQEISSLRAQKQQKEGQIQQLKSGEARKRIQDLEAQLQRERDLEPEVFAMFSDEKTLDTILLDIYNFIQKSDAELITYQPESNQASVITDGSLGALVNERLKRKTTTLEIQGTFAQTQQIIRDIERLQPLLLIKNLETTVSEKPSYFYNQGTISVEGEARLRSTFSIDAILPVNPAELPQPAPEEPVQ